MSLLETYISRLIPSNMFSETAYSIALLIYVLAVVYATKLVYSILSRRNMPHNVIVYYNRKIIHVFAGGVVALLVPIFFTSPLLPMILALALAIMNWIPHRTGKLLYWYQVEDNMYEVNFCIAWGLIIAVSWIFFGTPLYGIIPVLFMSFGDAATGFVRNTLYRKRTKSWWGNLAMFIVCASISYYYIGLWGIPVAAVASFIEHYEFNPIDDNILISVSTFLLLIILSSLGLIS
ncbi:MAG: dolichol kinase [Sulfolobales archaeon]